MGDNKQKKSFLETLGGAASGLAAQGSKALQGASKAVGDLGKKAGALSNTAKEQVINALDANGDGEVDIEDFIIHGLRVPGVGVNRESYLRAEFRKTFSEDVIDAAVKSTPAKAGITVEQIDKLADHAIAYERNCVTGISTALGMPGGAAMIATVPSDMIQYYGFMLRAAQKLLYLYGFPQIDVYEKNNIFDSETLNMMTLCLGVMFGVSGANQALRVIANALAKGVEKKLLQKALTKGTIYPIVKNIAKWFGQNMTKKVFAGFFKKAIPVVGGLVGGSITFLSFGPCCNKLRDSLRNTVLSNPDTIVADDEMIEISDVPSAEQVDQEKSLMISYSITSEKESCSFSYGIEVDALTDESIKNGLDDPGFSDSYWEQHYDFEPGIEKAKILIQTGHCSSFRDALFEIFGHFSVKYEVEGVEKVLDCNVDDYVYELIEETA